MSGLIWANVGKSISDIGQNMGRQAFQLELLRLEEEKALRLDEIKRSRDIADIPVKAQATADAAPILATGEAAAAPIRAQGEAAAAPIRAQGEAAAAPIKATGEAQGLIAKTQTPGYTEALQSETDAKESTSTKKYRGSQIQKIGAEINKIENDIAVGNVTGASRDRLTTIVNSANATIKSLNEGSKGRTAEEKAEWRRQMDAAIALRDRATMLLNENLGGTRATNPPARPGDSSSSTNRPPLSSFNR